MLTKRFSIESLSAGRVPLHVLLGVQLLGFVLTFLFQLLPAQAYAAAARLSVENARDTASDLNEIPVIQASGASRDEYLGFLQANGRKSLSDWLDKSALLEETADIEQLSRLVERAQSAWLNEPQATARSLLKQITNRAMDHDWPDAEREAIHYAYFRLAQLATRETERNDYLKLALIFDSEIDPDNALFPPPLVSRFQKMKSELMQSAHRVNFARVFPHHQILRINGRILAHPDIEVAMPEGRYRISAFSDQYPSFHETLTRMQLSELVLRQTPIANGHCPNDLTSNSDAAKINKTSLSALPGLRSAEVYFNSNCIEQAGENSAQKLAAQDPLASLMQPFHSPQDGGSANWPTAPDGSSTSVSRQTWLWVGASVLATSVAYYFYRDQQRRLHDTAAPPPEPTVRNLN